MNLFFDNKDKLKKSIKEEVYHKKYLEPILFTIDLLFKNKTKITKIDSTFIKEDGETIRTIDIHTSTKNVKRITDPDLFDSGKAKDSTDIILSFHNYNDEENNIHIDIYSDYKQNGVMVQRPFTIRGNGSKNELKKLLI